MENVEFLFCVYFDFQIVYFDEEFFFNEGEEFCFYFVLIDGYFEIMENGQCCFKFCIQFFGNFIFGDGKFDNQNYVIIFYCGEYIQFIDVNQDNYFEECFKICSVFVEFEEMKMDNVFFYIFGVKNVVYIFVVILGVCEYIFLENIGIFGDVVVGKEQMFGIFFVRILVEIGGKFYYGYFDFFNGIFMMICGGVFKV